MAQNLLDKASVAAQWKRGRSVVKSVVNGKPGKIRIWARAFSISRTHESAESRIRDAATKRV